MAVSQIDAIRDAGKRAAIAQRRGDAGRAALWLKWARDAARLEETPRDAITALETAYREESASYATPRGVSGSGRW